MATHSKQNVFRQIVHVITLKPLKLPTKGRCKWTMYTDLGPSVLLIFPTYCDEFGSTKRFEGYVYILFDK